MSTKLSISNLPAWKLAERQIRNWVLAREQPPAPPKGAAPAEVENFLAISRQVGAGGHEVATLVGEQLGWPVFDRQVLELMSGEDELRRQLYSSLDERDLTWLEEMVRMMGPEGPARIDYLHKLVEVILTLARKGHGVFLGRAVDLILPKSFGLRVRIVAPLDWRAENYARVNNLTPKQARVRIEEIGSDRAAFIRRYFHVEAEDPTRHDLVLNRARLTAEQVAQVIVEAMRIKGVIPNGPAAGPR